MTTRTFTRPQLEEIGVPFELGGDDTCATELSNELIASEPRHVIAKPNRAHASACDPARSERARHPMHRGHRDDGGLFLPGSRRRWRRGVVPTLKGGPGDSQR